MGKDFLLFEELRWEEYLLLNFFTPLPQGCYSCKEIHKAKNLILCKKYTFLSHSFKWEWGPLETGEYGKPPGVQTQKVYNV